MTHELRENGDLIIDRVPGAPMAKFQSGLRESFLALQDGSHVLDVVVAPLDKVDLDAIRDWCERELGEEGVTPPQAPEETEARVFGKTQAEWADERISQLKGQPYPDCFGDCGSGGTYCCDGLWASARVTAPLSGEASARHLREALRRIAQELNDNLTEDVRQTCQAIARSALNGAAQAPASPQTELGQPTRVLADGLLGLAEMVLEWWDATTEGQSGTEPDEGDPVCHLLNACYAIRDEPEDVQTHLYANFAPSDDEEPERKLIAAGHLLAALSTRAEAAPTRAQLDEFDAWLSFRPEFAEVLTAFREAFGTDTSARAEAARDEGEQASPVPTPTDKGGGE